MVKLKNFSLPKLGVDIDEVRIVAWMSKEGEAFSEGTILLEVETDKSVIEVPAPGDGRLVKILAEVGDTIDADATLAQVEADGNQFNELEPEHEKSTVVTDILPCHDTLSEPAMSVAAPAEAESGVDRSHSDSSRILSSPAARHHARAHGISLADISGSGPGGRIVLHDVKQEAAAIASSRHEPAPMRATVQTAAPSTDGLDQHMITTESGDLFMQIHRPVAPRSLPPVVLIHGLFSDSSDWSAVIHSLLKSGLTVYLIDLPGHGRSTVRVDSFRSLVDVVDAALQQAMTGPALLVGHSLGAAVSVMLASRSSSLFSGLVLLSPAGMGTEINDSFLRGVLNARTAQALKRELDKLSHSPLPLSNSIITSMLALLDTNYETLSAIVSEISVSGIQQIDLVENLASLSLPVTVIHGQDDKIIPWQHVLNLPGKVGIHLPGASGHVPHWQDVPLVSDCILSMAVSR